MKYVVGGIGDLLQSLPSLINANEEVVEVSSHFKKAEQIFSPFGIKAIKKIENAKEEAGRDFYLDKVSTPNPQRTLAKIKIDLLRTKTSKQIIGIHPIGSEFSNSYWYQRGKPIKLMPSDFIQAIIINLGDYVYFIFGTKEELEQYQNLKGETIEFICYDDIWQSLAFVDFCDAVIGVDSAIKSYSSMRRIPTICLVGDYEDYIRDTFFINKYVEDGVMKVFKFKNAEELNENMAVSIAEEVKKCLSQ